MGETVRRIQNKRQKNDALRRQLVQDKRTKDTDEAKVLVDKGKNDKDKTKYQNNVEKGCWYKARIIERRTRTKKWIRTRRRQTRQDTKKNGQDKGKRTVKRLSVQDKGVKDSEKVKCRTRGKRTVKRLSVGQGGKGQRQVEECQNILCVCNSVGWYSRPECRLYIEMNNVQKCFDISSAYNNDEDTRII